MELSLHALGSTYICRECDQPHSNIIADSRFYCVRSVEFKNRLHLIDCECIKICDSKASQFRDRLNKRITRDSLIHCPGVWTNIVRKSEEDLLDGPPGKPIKIECSERLTWPTYLGVS